MSTSTPRWAAWKTPWSGNDRSGTVDNNLNLLKAVELALTGGKDLIPFVDPMTGKTEKIRAGRPGNRGCRQVSRPGRNSGTPTRSRPNISSKNAWTCTRHPNPSAREFFPTPYLSCLVKGCAEKGLDITQGGAEISFVTLEAVTYATTVDSLLAINIWSSTRRNAPWRS